jgi:hypothetical protein
MAILTRRTREFGFPVRFWLGKRLPENIELRTIFYLLIFQDDQAFTDNENFSVRGFSPRFALVL